MTSQNQTPTDCLFIHIGVPSLSSGFAGLKLFFDRKGINTHLLKIDTPPPPKEKFLKILKPFTGVQLVAISIHWHPQISPSIKLAELIRVLPNFRDAKVVFGGMTASCFADELIRLPVTDFVIRGDGEVPLFELFRALSGATTKNKKYLKIPNLLFKDGGKVYESKDVYNTDLKTINEIELGLVESNELFKNTRSVLSFGRGCKQGCIYCGGNLKAFKRWGNRQTPLYRKGSDFAKSIDKAVESGVEELYLLSDYDGNGTFIANSVCKAQKLPKHITLDFMGLPKIEAIQRIIAHAEVVRGPDAEEMELSLEISPETAKDEQRDRVKDFFFTNKKLKKFLDDSLRELDSVSIWLFYSYYIVEDDPRCLAERETVWKLTRDYFNNMTTGRFGVYFIGLSTDPGATIQQGLVPWLVCDIKNLSDYHREMLKSRSPIGNFLKHRPSSMTPDELEYYHHFFNLECALRYRFPGLWVNLVSRFNNFADYDQWIQKSFDRVYGLFIKPALSSGILAVALAERQDSLFGFWFTSDQAFFDELEFLILVWLRAIQELYAQMATEESDAPVVTILDGGEFLPMPSGEHSRYCSELLDLALLSTSINRLSRSGQQQIFGDLLEANSEKIRELYRPLKNIRLLPVKNPRVELKNFELTKLELRGLTHRENLLLLGESFFIELTRPLDLAALPQSCLDYMSQVLEEPVEFIDDLVARPETYWSAVVNGDEEFAEILISLLIGFYVPVELVMAEMRWSRDPVISSTMVQKSRVLSEEQGFSWFYGLFDNLCDFRLILLYLEFLKATSPRSPENKNQNKKSGKGSGWVVFSLFLPDRQTLEKSLPVLSYQLGPVEHEIMVLSRGDRSVAELVVAAKQKFKWVTTKYIIHVLVFLYSRQLIY